MKELPTTTQPTFDLPDYIPGALDYTAQAHTDEMYAFVHLFRQQCPLFGLPEKAPLRKDGQKTLGERPIPP